MLFVAACSLLLIYSSAYKRWPFGMVIASPIVAVVIILGGFIGLCCCWYRRRVKAPSADEKRRLLQRHCHKTEVQRQVSGRSSNLKRMYGEDDQKDGPIAPGGTPGRHKRATVFYAHNPDDYVQIAPPNIPEIQRDNPGFTVDDINAQYRDEINSNETAVKRKIDSHRKLVREFVNFLTTLNIMATYDQEIEDQAIASKTQWMQGQIKTSDYVIFVITPSFLKFMENAPQEELFFQGTYLHSLIAGLETKSDGSAINMVCVFLNRHKYLDYVPTSLRTGQVYELWEPFELHDDRSDDLNTFVSLVNGRRHEHY